MVTIITEKLRNQSLDDVKVEAVPALQTASNNTWAFSTSPSSAFQLTGDKSWTMFLDPKDSWPGGPTPGTTAKTTPTAAGPGLTGGTAARGQTASHAPNPQTPIQVPSCPSDAKFAESCAELEAIPSTPPAPPLKRHCRSLSIPADRKDREKPSSTSSSTRWQPHAGQIWRPVASRPMSNKLRNRSSPSSNSLHRPAAVASRSSPHGPVMTGTGASGLRPLSKSEDFSTPPESPVPRPASASSGFCDSLVNSNWLEKAVVPVSCTASTSSLTSTASSALTGSNNNNWSNLFDPKLEAFRLRSLSMEEPISRLASAAGGVGRGACSMPAIPGSAKATHSTPSSPRRHRVQRCRSQPCVLHDRKCLKRRRDEERPALDFLKMTETAYDNGGHRTSSRCLPDNIRWTRSLASLFNEQQHPVHGLKTIASSPLDGSNLPASLTGTSNNGQGQTGNHSPSDTDNEVEEIIPRRGRSANRSGLPLHQRSSDNGSSDQTSVIGSRNHVSSFVDADDGCNCTNADNCKQADGEMFEMEMNNEIDLDQIEKD